MFIIRCFIICFMWELSTFINKKRAILVVVFFYRYSIVEFLLQSKINMHVPSNSGITPMCVAITHSNPAMVRYLIMYGYNVNKVCLQIQYIRY